MSYHCNMNVIIGTCGDDTITSTSGNNIVFAGWGDDTITTGDGNDIILAGGGDDIVISGGGDDYVYAGWGDDVVDAGSGNDVVYAGSGDDVVLAGDGNDYVNGGSGNDSLSGGNGNDVLIGGRGWGSDVIEGNEGNDVIYGGGGSDHLLGGEGCDYIVGGSGSDILVGGSGFDIMYGGSGNDCFVGCEEGGDVNYMVGGSGWDSVFYGGAASDYSVSYVGYSSWYGPIVKVVHTDSGATDFLFSVERIKFNQDVDSLKEGFTEEETTPPEAADDAVAIGESDNAAINILTNDNGNGETVEVVAVTVNGSTFVAGDSFVATTSGGRTGTVTVQADGSLTFTTDGNFEDLGDGEADTLTISYAIENANGQSDTANVTITINGENDAPIAADDAVATAENADGSFDAITANILSNDSDIDGDTLTVSSANGVAPGTEFTVASDTLGLDVVVTVAADGSVVMTPGAGFDALGQDETDTVSFAYEISDGNGGTDTATVSLTLTGINSGPVAADDAAEVTEGAGATFDEVSLNILDNDSDADGDTVTVSSANGLAPGTAFTLVSDTLNLDVIVTVDANGNVTMNADDGFAALGQDETDTVSFAYEVSDGNGGTDTATVSLTINGVNTGPVAADDAAATAENADGSFDAVTANILTNDSDVDGDTLTIVDLADGEGELGEEFELFSDENEFSVFVTVEENGDISMVPGEDFAELTDGEEDTVTFNYTVDDGNGGQDTAEVTLLVTGINAPPAAHADEYSVDEQADGSFTTVTANVLDNDTDPDSGNLEVSQVNGDAALVGQSFTVTSDTNGFEATVQIDDLGNISLTPGTDFASLNTGESDTVTVSYTAMDDTGVESSSTATLTVNGVDNATGGNDVSYNIVFMVDTGPTAMGTLINGAAHGLFDGVDPADMDLNGDGIFGGVVDAELAAVQQFSNEIANLNISDDVDIGVYQFSSFVDTTTFANFAAVTDISDGDNVFDAGQDLSSSFQGLTGSDFSSYEGAVDGAIDFLSAATTDDVHTDVVNLVYVLAAGDGFFLGPNNSATLDGMGATVDTLAFTQAGTSDIFLAGMEIDTGGDGVVSVIDNQLDLDALLGTPLQDDLFA
ncbi:MAG: Ig-like domain-containing protein [Pikeienuella sp.]